MKSTELRDKSIKVYKYYCWGDFVKSVIINNEIYFASVDEYKFCAFEFRQNFTPELIKSFGIFSCSQKYDNHILWSEFAQFNTGVCLEFEFDNDFIDSTFIHDRVNYISKIELTKHKKVKNNLPDLFLIDEKLKKEEEYRIIKTNLENRKIKYPENSLKKIILGIDFKEIHFKELKEIISVSANKYLDRIYKINNDPFLFQKSSYTISLEPEKI